eukprot:g530.t1
MSANEGRSGFDNKLALGRFHARLSDTAESPVDVARQVSTYELKQQPASALHQRFLLAGGAAQSDGAGGANDSGQRHGRAARGFLSDTMGRAMVFLLALLGVCASVLAWAMDEVVLGVQSLHTKFADLAAGSWFGRYVLWLLFRIAAATAAVLLTARLGPVAAGSGIPEMRSVLEGFDLDAAPSGRRGRAPMQARGGFLSLSTLVAKVLGLVLAIGAGLSVGKEGPFVHTSSIVAYQLLRLRPFRVLSAAAGAGAGAGAGTGARGDGAASGPTGRAQGGSTAGARVGRELQQHVLSAACAVGVAAAFGAPMGGVLFSIEVTSHIYLTRNYWGAFFCAVCGAATFALLHGQGDVALFGTAFDSGDDVYSHGELPLFALLALGAGALGGAFVRLFAGVVRWRRAQQRRGRLLGRNSYAFAAAAVVLVGVVEYPIGEFMLLSNRGVIIELFDSHESGIGANSTNVRTAWSQGGGLGANLVLFVAIRFVATALMVSLAIPCGVVTPVFAVGAGIGRAAGELFAAMHISSELVAGGYAVVGAAAFCAGVTGTVSVAVIVFELTGQLSLALPVLLAVVLARAAAATVSDPIYDTIAVMRGLPAWPVPRSQRAYELCAADVMRAVDTAMLLPRRATRGALERQLRRSAGRGGEDAAGGDDAGAAPVAEFALVENVDAGEGEGARALLGVARRGDLERLLRHWPAGRGESGGEGEGEGEGGGGTHEAAIAFKAELQRLYAATPTCPVLDRALKMGASGRSVAETARRIVKMCGGTSLPLRAPKPAPSTPANPPAPTAPALPAAPASAAKRVVAAPAPAVPIAHFAKCKPCSACGKRPAKLDCVFSMCQQCCVAHDPSLLQCESHAKPLRRKREEDELIEAFLHPPKRTQAPKMDHYETSLETHGETVTIFCLRDFLGSKHAEEALAAGRTLRRKRQLEAIASERRRQLEAIASERRVGRKDGGGSHAKVKRRGRSR